MAKENTKDQQTPQLTADQQGARMMALFANIQLTDSEYQDVMLGTPYDQWSEELKKKMGSIGLMIAETDREAMRKQ